MIIHISPYTKKISMYTFKRVKYMVYDLYINEVIKLKKEKNNFM